MEFAAKCARTGNRILSFIAIVLILIMLLYGGYSLWDSTMIYKSGFADDDLLKFKPSSDGEDNLSLEELMKINPDVRAWLTIDNTHIDYPVVQGETDMEYLNKDVYGEFVLSGSIFLSCLNSPDFSDQYNLVYGHHMASGAMFGDVADFRDSEYFETHKTGNLYLLDKTYDIELFACLFTDAYDEMVYSPDVQSSGNMGTFLKYLQNKSEQYRDIGVTENDQIIGLSTCSEAASNGRIIVFGKLTD